MKKLKKLKKITMKKIARYSLFSVVINQAAVAFAPVVAAGFYCSKITIAQRDLAGYERLPEDFTVLDYLNISNSLANLDFADNHNNSADCKDYSLATYDAYRYLVRINGRKDLEDKVRLAFGWEKEMGIGHVLLEYKDGNGIKTYETTLYTPGLTVDEVRSYSDYTENTKTSYGLEKVWGRSLMGNRFTYPTIDGFLFPGGVVRLVVSFINYQRIKDS